MRTVTKHSNDQNTKKMQSRGDAPVVGFIEMVLEIGKVDPVDPVVAHAEPDEQEDREGHVRRPVARRREDLLQTVLGEGVVDALVATGPHLQGRGVGRLRLVAGVELPAKRGRVLKACVS